MEMVDAAERAVFNLKQEMRDEYGKSYFKKRRLLEELMPIVADMHIRARAMVTEIMDICDRLEPFYTAEGGGR